MVHMMVENSVVLKADRKLMGCLKVDMTELLRVD